MRAAADLAGVGARELNDNVVGGGALVAGELVAAEDQSLDHRPRRTGDVYVMRPVPIRSIEPRCRARAPAAHRNVSADASSPRPTAMRP